MPSAASGNADRISKYAFNELRDLHYDQAGHLYAADDHANWIEILAPDKSLLPTLGSGRGGAWSWPV